MQVKLTSPLEKKVTCDRFAVCLSTPQVSDGTQAVPNLQRITVQGSTSIPAEWLRLTIDTDHSPAFIWTNVAYCADPLVGCQ